MKETKREKCEKNKNKKSEESEKLRIKMSAAT